jgi:hypothetical protein
MRLLNTSRAIRRRRWPRRYKRITIGEYRQFQDMKRAWSKRDANAQASGQNAEDDWAADGPATGEIAEDDWAADAPPGVSGGGLIRHQPVERTLRGKRIHNQVSEKGDERHGADPSKRERLATRQGARKAHGTA